jgi:putative hydrolase of the HAD superfamily
MTFSDIALVCFDADDTLWDFSAMMQRGTQAVADYIQQHLGAEYAYLTPSTLTEAQHQYIETQDPQTIDYLEARRVVFGRLFQTHPQRQQIANDLVKVYVTARNLRYEFFEDAHSTLEALQSRYLLGWITNGTTTPQEVGLEGVFDVVVMPDTLNLRKPKPEVFLHAAKQAGCKIGQVLHVGDNLITDVGGARWTGAHGVWYNPNGQPNPTKIQPSAEVQRLSQVLELLAL